MTRIDVEPNPAVEGQPVTITVEGPGPWLVMGDPDGEVREHEPDSQGQIELTAPPGASGGTFTVMNSADPPVSQRVDIVRSG
jgi:hypothetical protein